MPKSVRLERTNTTQTVVLRSNFLYACIDAIVILLVKQGIWIQIQQSPDIIVKLNGLHGSVTILIINPTMSWLVEKRIAGCFQLLVQALIPVVVYYIQSFIQINHI